MEPCIAPGSPSPAPSFPARLRVVEEAVAVWEKSCATASTRGDCLAFPAAAIDIASRVSLVAGGTGSAERRMKREHGKDALSEAATAPATVAVEPSSIMPLAAESFREGGGRR